MSSLTRQSQSIDTMIAILNDPSRMPKPSQRHLLIEDLRAAAATIRNEALRRENEANQS